MTFRIHEALVFCVLITLSVLLVHAPEAAAVVKISIPISIMGLPPELVTRVAVDGIQQGTIPGGGTKSFQVDKSKPHTFQVDAEIKGLCASYEGKGVCTRYMNPNNVWNLDVVSTQNCQTVPVCYQVYVCDWWGCWWDYRCTYEQRCWTTTELSEKGHTFEYFAEHQVSISDVHGQNVDNWIKDGADLNISADEFVMIRDESNIKERDVFQAWIVNGAPTESRTLALKIDKPYFIRAEYRTEIQYRVRVSSEFGHPTLDNPDGWYMKGQEATVSVEKELPLEGLMGALGGRRMFVAWHSPQGIESREPAFGFAVTEPTSLQTEWRKDESQPMTIIAALAIIAIAVLVIFGLYMKGALFRARPAKAELTELDNARIELEKAKLEIERLRQELEQAKGYPAE